MRLGGLGTAATIAAWTLVMVMAMPSTATSGDAQAFMGSLPSGGHSKTCDKPVKARVNSDEGEAVNASFVNQKYNAKRGSWKTLSGYTQRFTFKPNRWITFSHVVFGGCGFGKGKYRVVVRAKAFYMTYDNGVEQKHVVGRDSASRTYKVT